MSKKKGEYSEIAKATKIFGGSQIAILISNILRTDNFTIDRTTGVSYPGATEESVREVLKQEKFEEAFLLNAVGGKSWKVNQYYA